MFSWALIFQKMRLFSRLERETTAFLRAFRTTRSLPDPKAVAGLGSPLEVLYSAGYRELSSQLAVSGGNPHGSIKSLGAITTDMQMAAGEEIRKVEKYMPWLATTGSVTPFIGLFGTVWGVMGAFSGLGEAGAASLRAVAPGIAEALITTAMGLFTAIPAVMAYNHFLHHIKRLGARMDNFTMEVAALIEKQYL
jgi:biopolymer transport protein TolQ